MNTWIRGPIGGARLDLEPGADDGAPTGLWSVMGMWSRLVEEPNLAAPAGFAFGQFLAVAVGVDTPAERLVFADDPDEARDVIC